MKFLLALVLTICLSTTALAYQPRWTWPGAIEQHLYATHGLNVSGMSYTDMLRLHDSLHDQEHGGHMQPMHSYVQTHPTGRYQVQRRVLIPQRRFFFRRMR